MDKITFYSEEEHRPGEATVLFFTKEESEVIAKYSQETGIEEWEDSILDAIAKAYNK